MDGWMRRGKEGDFAHKHPYIAWSLNHANELFFKD